MPPLGAVVHARRRRLELTQATLAKLVGCTVRTIQRVERAAHSSAPPYKPSPLVIRGLARALELEPKELSITYRDPIERPRSGYAIATGARIRRLRVAKGLTPQQVASQAQCTSRTIQRWERGDVDEPKPSLYTRLPEALGVEPFELWGDLKPSWLKQSAPIDLL